MGTHPIFESDFDCLTDSNFEEMSVSIVNMTETWRELKLAEIQADMDQTATNLANRKDESDTSRKKLIVESKKFKKDTPEEARKQVQPLLKLFQSEVDALSKRAKAAETAFLSIYAKIIELPDPLPALEQAEVMQKKAHKLGEIEIENQKLKDTINTYKKDFAEMKNNESKIEKLEKQLNLASASSQEASARVFDEREKELLELFEEKEKEMQETQRMVASKLASTESRAVNAQQKLEAAQNELMGTQRKNEEIELIMNDLERANHNYEAATKEIEHINEQRAANSNSAKSSSRESEQNEIDVAQIENEMAAKERELSQLTTELARLEKKHSLEANQLQRQLKDAHDKSAKLEQEKMFAECKLVDQKDYIDIKRECEILKETQFSGVDKAKLESQTLEALLLSQNRNLQSENSSMRKQINEINNELNNVQVRENILKNQVQNQDALIEKLEKDLLSVNALPSAYRTGGDGAASSGSSSTMIQHEFLENALKDVTQRSSALLQEVPQTNLSGQSTNGDSDPSLLSIVQSQRERFRLRVQELENENSSQAANIGSLTQEIENLRLDNVKLYEKIKFLQNYRPNSANSGYQTNVDDEAGRKYASQYEDQLDPFMKFSRNEKLRKYTNLSAHDKITLNMGKFILSNKIARTCIFVYTIVIHMLLYVILYKFGNVTDCKSHLGEMCAERFGEDCLSSCINPNVV